MNENELTIIDTLKPGGQKNVYLAEHPTLGKVVFKKIKPNRDGLERTKREVRAASLITINVPRIFAHNCEEVNPSYIWLIEEYIEGLSLRDALNEGKPFTTFAILQFLKTMLSIAVEGENNNVVHRDIKPDNIIVDADYNFWLLDYGIARHLDLESITDSNQPFGAFTVGYASSEQFRNLKSFIDIRADLFSIGVVAHEIISGKNYYTDGLENDIFRVIKRLENSSLPPLEIDGDSEYQLSAFIRMLGDHRRTRRPRTAKEALSILNVIEETLNLE